MGPHCLPYGLLKYFSRREKQTTFVAIGALRVNFFIIVIYDIWPTYSLLLLFHDFAFGKSRIDHFANLLMDFISIIFVRILSGKHFNDHTLHIGYSMFCDVYGIYTREQSSQVYIS